MSKKMTDDELHLHLLLARNYLDEFLTDMESGTEAHKKKAQLLGYWVSDYINFLKREDSFLPFSIPQYKRGSVIIADFGFRIGKEFGGRHFAVVLDNDNKRSSHMITVCPLSSLKEGFSDSDISCQLPDGVYKPYYNKVATIIQKAKSASDHAEQSENSEEKKKLAKEMDDLLQLCLKGLDEMVHMKQGSIAVTSQIMTISKMRIVRPLRSKDLLSGIRLSEKDMDIINDRVVRRIVFAK